LAEAATVSLDQARLWAGSAGVEAAHRWADKVHHRDFEPSDHGDIWADPGVLRLLMRI
jgi:hypothetical protein